MEKLELVLDFGKCMASIVTVTCFVLKRIRGRRIYNPYALFEALKVRDFGSNRYNVTATMKKSVRIRRNHLCQLLFFFDSCNKKRVAWTLALTPVNEN